MAKFTRGIPDSFTLDVGPVTDLGDYLDEPPPSRPAKTGPEVAVPHAKRSPAGEAKAFVAAKPNAEPLAVAVTARAESATAPPPVPVRSTTPEGPGPTPAPENDPAALPRTARPKAPRREVSMTAEVMRMSDELLDLIRRGSGQRDTTANELFHALVLLAYDVKDELDTHSGLRRSGTRSTRRSGPPGGRARR